MQSTPDAHAHSCWKYPLCLHLPRASGWNPLGGSQRLPRSVKIPQGSARVLHWKQSRTQILKTKLHQSIHGRVQGIHFAPGDASHGLTSQASVQSGQAHFLIACTRKLFSEATGTKRGGDISRLCRRKQRRRRTPPCRSELIVLCNGSDRRRSSSWSATLLTHRVLGQQMIC